MDNGIGYSDRLAAATKYISMKLPTLIKHLMGYIIQVTEYKYSVAVLRNDLLSDGV